MSKHHSNDPELEALLNAVDVQITPQRLHQVRTAILVSAHEMGRRTIGDMIGAFMGLRPSMLLATGLLGLFLGASLPGMMTDLGTTSAAFLDYRPQAFLTGDIG